jgi:hypothetical protein
MAEQIDYTKQPLPFSVIYAGRLPGGGGTPDMSEAGVTPPGFRVGSRRDPAACQHHGNPPGYTWCKDCGTRLVP